MRVVFDNIIYSLQKSGGGSVYWTELLKRFGNTNEDIIYVEHKGCMQNIFRKDLCLNSIVKEQRLPLTMTRFLPLTKVMSNKSIFHSSYYRYSHSSKAINVLTLHDFTAEHFWKGVRKKVNYSLKKRAIKHSDGIICISQHTKKDLLQLHPWVDESKIRVIYNGVGDSFFPVDRKGRFFVNEFDITNQLYILYVGHRTKGYKNFEIAVQTLHKLPKEFVLIVAGEPFSDEEQVFISKEKLVDRVKLIVKPSTIYLNYLYNFAHCFLYPSSYEGFGIPVLEAMKAGCPVVAVSQSSIPEVAGSAALLVDKPVSELFSQAILQVSGQRDELVSRGIEQVQHFSWDKCFDEVYKFYKDLYGES